LAAFGGTWSSPPALPTGWRADDRIAEQRARAAQLLAELPPKMVVKDPRLSLVMPLWDDLAEPQPAIICLRNPTAVAQSLQKRNGFTLDQGYLLWFRYNASAVLSRPTALVVEYERLLEQPEVELHRVADHIELEPGDMAIGAAADSVRTSMAHGESTEVPDSPAGRICTALHELLRTNEPLDSRHDVYLWARLVTELPWAGPSDPEVKRAQALAKSFKRQIERLANENARLVRRCERLESDLRQSTAVLDRIAFAESAALAQRTKDYIQ
jgi:hypothetical protein